MNIRLIAKTEYLFRQSTKRFSAHHSSLLATDLQTAFSFTQKENGKKISALPTLEFENYIRQVYSNTVDVQIDSQGRFIIPQFLKEQVGIEKDVLFMGVGTHIEIWSREAFQEKQKTIDMNEMKKLMIQMGF